MQVKNAKLNTEVRRQKVIVKNLEKIATEKAFRIEEVEKFLGEQN